MFILETLKPAWYIDLFRAIMYMLDWAIYSIISIAYNLIDEIAGLSLLSDATFEKMAMRIYILLGVFILFKTTFSLINMFLNPDSFTDAKMGGAKLVTKIMTMLVLLISVPAIFENMFRLQAIILNQNVLGNIVMGASSYADNVNKTATNAGDLIGGTTFRAFFTPNFTLEDGTIDYKGCEDCATVYKDKYASISSFGSILNKKSENEYIFNYSVLVSTIAGGLAAFLMLTFAFDIGLRSIKLTFLQLIAPIPIIASIDPKKGGETLKTWTSEVTSTFLDLFVRLLMIYFVVFLISEIFANDNFLTVYRYNEQGVAEQPTLVSLAGVFLIIGLLNFAKVAPKLIYGLLGIKMPEGGMGLNPLKKLLGTPGVGKLAGAGIGAWDAKKHGKSIGAGLRRGASAIPLGGGSAKLKDLRPNHEARKKAQSDKRENTRRNKLGQDVHKAGKAHIQSKYVPDKNNKLPELSKLREDFIKNKLFGGEGTTLSKAFQKVEDIKGDKTKIESAYEMLSRRSAAGDSTFTYPTNYPDKEKAGKEFAIEKASNDIRLNNLAINAKLDVAKKDFEVELNVNQKEAAAFNSLEYEEKQNKKLDKLEYTIPETRTEEEILYDQAHANDSSRPTNNSSNNSPTMESSRNYDDDYNSGNSSGGSSGSSSGGSSNQGNYSSDGEDTPKSLNVNIDTDALADSIAKAMATEIAKSNDNIADSIKKMSSDLGVQLEQNAFESRKINENMKENINAVKENTNSNKEE